MDRWDLIKQDFEHDVMQKSLGSLEKLPKDVEQTIKGNHAKGAWKTFNDALNPTWYLPRWIVDTTADITGSTFLKKHDDLATGALLLFGGDIGDIPKIIKGENIITPGFRSIVATKTRFKELPDIINADVAEKLFSNKLKDGFVAVPTELREKYLLPKYVHKDILPIIQAVDKGIATLSTSKMWNKAKNISLVQLSLSPYEYLSRIFGAISILGHHAFSPDFLKANIEVAKGNTEKALQVMFKEQPEILAKIKNWLKETRIYQDDPFAEIGSEAEDKIDKITSWGFTHIITPLKITTFAKALALDMAKNPELYLDKLSAYNRVGQITRVIDNILGEVPWYRILPSASKILNKTILHPEVQRILSALMISPTYQLRSARILKDFLSAVSQLRFDDPIVKSVATGLALQHIISSALTYLNTGINNLFSLTQHAQIDDKHIAEAYLPQERLYDSIEKAFINSNNAFEGLKKWLLSKANPLVQVGVDVIRGHNIDGDKIGDFGSFAIDLLQHLTNILSEPTEIKAYTHSLPLTIIGMLLGENPTTPPDPYVGSIKKPLEIKHKNIHEAIQTQNPHEFIQTLEQAYQSGRINEKVAKQYIASYTLTNAYKMTPQQIEWASKFMTPDEINVAVATKELYEKYVATHGKPPPPDILNAYAHVNLVLHSAPPTWQTMASKVPNDWVALQLALALTEKAQLGLHTAKKPQKIKEIQENYYKAMKELIKQSKAYGWTMTPKFINYLFNTHNIGQAFKEALDSAIYNTSGMKINAP